MNRLRALSKRPLYATLTLATLALGLGTSVAMFAVVHAVLLRPLPVQDQNQLVFITKHPRNDRQVLPFTYPESQATSRLTGIVESSGGVQYDAPLPYGLRFGSQAFNANVTSVTAGFFSVLGTTAELGRAPQPPAGRSRRWNNGTGLNGSLMAFNLLVAAVTGLGPLGSNLARVPRDTVDALAIPVRAIMCRPAQPDSAAAGIVVLAIMEQPPDTSSLGRSFTARYDRSGVALSIVVMMHQRIPPDTDRVTGIGVDFSSSPPAGTRAVGDAAALVPASGVPGVRPRKESLTEAEIARARLLADWLWSHRCGKPAGG